MERTKMPNLRNGNKEGFEPGLTWLRVRHSTTELPLSMVLWENEYSLTSNPLCSFTRPSYALHLFSLPTFFLNIRVHIFIAISPSTHFKRAHACMLSWVYFGCNQSFSKVLTVLLIGLVLAVDDSVADMLVTDADVILFASEHGRRTQVLLWKCMSCVTNTHNPIIGQQLLLKPKNPWTIYGQRSLHNRLRS